ncbi:hypothetical protein D3C84_918910 [compost metagenome]
MDLTTTQIFALIGIALFELIAGVIIYVIARISGFKSGRRAGYRTGIEVATDELEPQLHEMTARCTSAERMLAAELACCRRLEDERDQLQRNAAEAIEELTTRLDDAQVLNDRHGTLLRQAAGKFEYVAGKLQLINLTDDARQSITLAGQLRDLAAWLKPQTQHMERAA